MDAMTKYIKSGLATGLLMTASVCTAATGFDVNDVSILLPKTKNLGAPIYPNIGLDLKNNKNQSPLLGPKLFSDIVGKFKKRTGENDDDNRASPNFSVKDFSKFKVVNFRYDPCFPDSDMSQPICLQQIRLVAQPMGESANSNSTEIFAPDYSIHLLYELGKGLPSQTNSTLQELVKLKETVENSGVSNAGKALAVSPALSIEMKKFNNKNPGPIAKALLQILQNNISEQNLKEVTLINGSSDENLLGTWNFIGGVINNGQWVIKTIPRTKNKIDQQVSDLKGGLTDDTVSSKGPNVATFDDLNVMATAIPKGDTAEATRALSELEALQNPQLTNPRNTDCASCHMAPSSEGFLIQNNGNWVQNQSPKTTYKIPKGITGFVNPKFLAPLDQGVMFGDVHVIGYFQSNTVVTPIVAYSAASVAEKLNQILGLSAPTSRDCNSMAAKTCFMNSASTEADCLKLCK